MHVREIGHLAERKSIKSEQVAKHHAPLEEHGYTDVDGEALRSVCRPVLEK